MSRKTNRLKRRLEMAHKQAERHERRLMRLLNGSTGVNVEIALTDGSHVEARCLLKEIDVGRGSLRFSVLHSIARAAV